VLLVLLEGGKEGGVYVCKRVWELVFVDFKKWVL